MKTVLYIVLVFCFSTSHAQPNCDAYLYYKDTLKYNACVAAENTSGHYQFSKEYQQALDRSLEIDPTYAYAYKEKSTAFLKSGDFVTWKKLIDKAVKYDPKDNLGYRGWCRFQFFRDYEGAISDIETLDSLLNYDIGYSVNGDYHLQVARAICYKALGQFSTAISIIEKQLGEITYSPGLYDYLHLGVLYLEVEDYDKVIECLKKQETENDLSENRYFIALAYEAKANMREYITTLVLSKSKHLTGNTIHDPDTEPVDKIYLEDVKLELETALKDQL